MAENKEEKNKVRDEVTENVNNASLDYFKFSKPYVWEDKTYDGLDLSKFEDVTAQQIWEFQRTLTQSGFTATIPELETEYCCYFMSTALDLPLDFFRRLPAKDAVKLRVRVSNFLLT